MHLSIFMEEHAKDIFISLAISSFQLLAISIITFSFYTTYKHTFHLIELFINIWYNILTCITHQKEGGIALLPIFLTIENDEERSLAEDLYLTYKSKMYRIAYAVLHNKEDAEDVVMDSVY